MPHTTVSEDVPAMKVETYEAVVENGQIKFADIVRLREHTKVYVVVPAEGGQREYHVSSPRLAKPDQAAEFAKIVVEEPDNAGV